MKRMPEKVRTPQSNRTIENAALYFAAGSAVLSALVCLLAFWGNVPLYHGLSIGLMATILATAAAFVAYFYATTLDYVPSQRSWLGVAHDIFTKFSLSFVHGAIVFLLVTIMFFVVSEAFVGLELDKYAASAIVAGVVGAMSYAAYLVAANVTTLRVSTALAVFLVAGVLISMVTADDPEWWNLHLSSLGAGSSLSSHTFDITLMVGGAVIAALADFVTYDFARLKVSKRYQHVRVNILRSALVLVGIFLACVGLFRYDTSPFLHNSAATGLVVVFLGLLGSMPWLVPSFSRVFYVFTYGFVGALLVCAYLYTGVGYFNLTAFEIISFALIFSWLIVFIRQIAAALEDDTSS